MPIVDGVQTPGNTGRANHVGDPLTVAEIAALPDGAEVVITWAGGNGPWPYRVLVDYAGTRRTEGLYCDPILTFGPDQAVPLHRVTLGWDDATRTWAESTVPMPDHIKAEWRYWRAEWRLK